MKFTPKVMTSSPRKHYQLAGTLAKIFLVILAVGIFTSCVSDELLKKTQTTSKTAPKTTKKKFDFKKPFAKRTTGVSKSKTSKSPKTTRAAKTVREAFQAGEYNTVLSLTQDTDDVTSLYYRAMTYFSMMFYNHQFPKEKIAKFRQEVLELLPRVTQEASGELQARAKLWHAVALDVSYVDRTHKLQAIKLFREVQKDTASREKLYNEALLYSGNLYARIGNYVRAREFYSALAKTPYPEDLVYDYVRKEFSTVEQAVTNARARLKLYMDGQHPAYKVAALP